MRILFKKSLLLALSASLVLGPLQASQADLFFKKPVKSLAVTPTGTDSGGGSGGGTSPTPAVASLSTSTLSFGTLPVGSSVQALSVRLTNTGGSALALSAAPSTSGSGLFSALSGCGATLAPNSFCDTTVSFNPVTEGTFSGALNFSTSSGSQSVSLSAVTQGTHSQSVSASSLAFGPVNLGSSSNLTVRLTNTGNVPLTVAAGPTLAGSAAFTSSTSCGSAIGVGAHCDTQITFTPIAENSVSGSMSITTDAGTETISLSGSGVGARAADLSSSALAFGAVSIGTTANLSVRLTNAGNVPLLISSAPALSGNAAFASSTNCGASLAVGAYCDTSVTFTPSVENSVGAILSIGTDAGVQSVSVGGSGVGTRTASVSTTSLAFGSLAVGTTSTLPVRLTNNGNVPLVLNAAPAISGSALFTKATDCGASISVGGYCDTQVTFNASTAGTASGTLSFDTDAGTKTVSLGATAVAGTVTLVGEGGTSFGNVFVGQSNTLHFTFSNTSPFTVSNVYADVAGAGISFDTNNCGSVSTPRTLTSGETCGIIVRYTPSVAGTLSGASLTLVTSATSPSVATLSGTGVQVVGAVAPTTSDNFGNVAVGSSATLTYTYTNSGNVAGTGTYVSLSSTANGLSLVNNNCGTSGAKVSVAGNNGSCTFGVQFSPTSFGTLNAPTIQVLGDNGVATSIRTLTGTATQANLALTSTSLSSNTIALGTVNVNSNVSSATVTLTNSGNVSATGVWVAVTGNSAVTLVQDAQYPCGTASNSTVTLTTSGNSASCKFTVKYAPTVIETLSGVQLTVTANSPVNSVPVVAITGNGFDPAASVSFLGQFDGANGSTTITDSSGAGNNGTAVGSAKISTAVAHTGSGALLLNPNVGDTTDYVTLPVAAGVGATGAFTIEGWIYPVASTSGVYMLYNQYESLTSGRFLIDLENMKLAVGHGTAASITSTATVPINTWTHWAVTRDSSNTVRLFINGTVVGSATNWTGSIEQSKPWIGKFNNSSYSGAPFRGYMDGIRVTKGAARYTSNFTPTNY